ncbi:M61 family metallopeptidase [Fimbriiglobus ruber]|uniref:PDZ domain family protein n=1 Tax=Fimbriiglobus ruber TaxID=1908690 RepID=A0A225E0Q2_9BACT|nr:M61 family metallopeptidase [Fimbriiglobus ruber]OWK45384.1 PDZ domain family protein [Fimbriiglobus ruber]
MRWLWFAVLSLAVTPCTAPASPQGGQPDAKTPPITLDVDVSEAPQKIYHARLVIPATPGPLTLYYPKWIPGTHGPSGPVAEVAGLKIQAGGKPVAWKRDDTEMFTFHCTVPEGATSIEVALDWLAAGRGGFGTTTDHIAVVRWNELLLYPKGKPISAIEFQASVKVPAGWKLGTALPVESHDGAVTRFRPVSLETLVDSPVHAGLYFREIPLTPKPVGGKPTDGGLQHFLELACDGPGGLEITPDIKAHYEQLVVEAGALFGTRHYKSYRFLVTLSDKMPYHGLEHHESSDNGMPERAMSDPEAGKAIAFLLPHEYVHSWNGKFRRPRGLITPTYQEANNTRLLWVYEGLTEYLGTVLAARSGLWTPDDAREYLAVMAEDMQNQKGRSWRPLEDTTLVAPMRAGDASGWRSWRRSTDYYDEGQLIWLEIDTKIRQLTKGERSLDDFCRRFFAGPNGVVAVKGYELEDVLADLNAVAEYDWKTLLMRRVTETAEQAPLDGLTQGGWRLTYADKPSAFEKSAQGLRKRLNLSTSLGVLMSPDGVVSDVVRGKAAYKAGIGPGMKVLAVNGRRFSPEVLREAVAASKKSDATLEFLVESGDMFRTYAIDYRDGARYPRLERLAGEPDTLTKILAPKTAAPAKSTGTGK